MSKTRAPPRRTFPRVNRRLRALLAPLVPLRVVLPWIFFWKGPRKALAGRWGWARSLRDKATVDERGSPLPWLPYAATQLLAERLSRAHTVLEFGAGSSTLFSMDRVARVVSLEHDPVWLAWARARIRGNVELIATVQEPAEAYRAPLGASGERFDLILVNGAHRNEAFADAVGRLAPGGVILLDDSHRSRLKPCFEAAAAAGLRHLHLEGHKPMSVDVHRTTLFYRDGNCLGI